MSELRFTTKVNTTPDKESVIRNQKDALGIEVFGAITDYRNIEILNFTLDEERKFNDPSIAYRWVAQNYTDSVNRFGDYRYKAELELIFVDIDVFRQPALHFEKYGVYCPFSKDYDKYAYDTYWDIQEYRRRYGMTAYAGIDLVTDEKRLVHIPGNLYGFLNFAPIQRITDAELEDDDLKFADSNNVEELATIKMEDLLKELQVPRRKVAKKNVFFPSFFDSQYHLIVAKNFARAIGKNFFYVKARRKGSSYFNAWDLFNNIDLTPDIAVILAASDKKYLTMGKGLMKMLYTYSDFVNLTTDFTKQRIVKSKEHLKFGYYKEGSTEEYGYRSEALAVSAKNNADVTIGKDVYEIDYEELGKFPNFLESYDVTTSTAEAGAYKTGMLCGWGTGGTDDANWKDFELVARKPSIVDSLPCEDIWSAEPRGAVIYMLPHVHGLEGAMDYNGNTDFVEAWKIYREERKQKEEDSKGDLTSYERWISQRANTHDEAFTRYSSNMFNIRNVRNQMRRLISEPEALAGTRYGWLEEVNGAVVFTTNQERMHEGLEWHPPILDYPTQKGDDLHGCYTEHYTPYVDPRTGLIPDNLYVAIQDPYAHDKDKTKIGRRDSLGATYIVQRANNFLPFKGKRIVASYVGRPPLVSTYNGQAALMLRRWNAKMLFENNIGDTKTFMNLKGMYEYLIDEPTLAFNPEIAGKSGRNKGIHMTVQRINVALAYFKELLEEVQHIDPLTDEKYDFLYYIKDLGLLNEIIKFDGERNFDRISAMIMYPFIEKEYEHLKVDPETNQNAGQSIFDTIFF